MTVTPVCSECAHHRGNRTCSAYPAKIPDAIWKGGDSHTAKRDDQAGEAVLETRDQAGLTYLVKIGRVSLEAYRSQPRRRALASLLRWREGARLLRTRHPSSRLDRQSRMD